MRSIMINTLKKIGKILLPSFCVNCKTETPEEPTTLRWLCLNCHRILVSRWQKSSYQPEIAASHFLFDYQKDILAQRLIRAMKYNSVKEIADVFGVVLEKERLNLRKLDFDLIAPVPLHKRRLKERGFNQSLLLAKKISAITEKEIMDGVLERKIYRRPQADIKKRAEREKNISGIFSCPKLGLGQNICGKTILLVDDVSTTGATIKECARVLKTAGAAKVLSLVLAQD